MFKAMERRYRIDFQSLLLGCDWALLRSDNFDNNSLQDPFEPSKKNPEESLRSDPEFPWHLGQLDNY